MTWMLFDWLGTVAFAVSGAMVGLSKRMDIFGVVVLAVLTAVGGGMLRDLMAQKVPVVLRMDVYAVASLVGAFVMCTAWPYGADGASWIGFFVVLLLRHPLWLAAVSPASETQHLPPPSCGKGEGVPLRK